MSSEIQVTETQLIPSVDLSGLEKALAAIDTEAALLPQLKERAEAIVVKDAQSFSEAGALRYQVRTIIKAAETHIGPFKIIVDRAKNFLTDVVKRRATEARPIDDLLTKKLSDYIPSETDASKKEEQQINKGKPAAQHVEVKPAIPTISGSRRHWVYLEQIVDEDALLKQWANATGNERKWLRQFICANVNALHEAAKDAGDDLESLNKKVKGVKFSRMSKV